MFERRATSQGKGGHNIFPVRLFSDLDYDYSSNREWLGLDTSDEWQVLGLPESRENVTGTDWIKGD